MTLRERLRALDQLQRARGFKIAASALILAVGLIVLGVYFVTVTAPAGGLRLELPPGVAPELAQQQQRELELVSRLITGGGGRWGMAVGVLTVCSAALLAVWLGLGLTAVGVGLVSAAVVVPLFLYEPTAGLARLLAGVIVLGAALIVFMRGLQVVFSLPGPVFAVARNVIAEAVRLKVSLVFIVLLVFALASLPLLLDPEQALRYRVQAFLQYATGTSFWTIALLVLFFSVATVAFEQRDKVIWQTMTKPVAPWQYLLGKWLGVVGLALVLLSVAGSGVFLFTEYLRNQPALGEVRPFEPRGEGAPITEDRLVLETQVLSARRTATPLPARLLFGIDIEAAVNQRIADERRQDPTFQPTLADRNRIAREIDAAASLEYQSIDPVNEQYEDFRFVGLQRAKRADLPVTLRYKIEAEGQRPDVFYTMSFLFPDGTRYVRKTGLGFSHTLTISPDAITDDGVLDMRVVNGEVVATQSGAQGVVPNPGVVTFPSDGLEVSYAVGSYRLNFARVVLVLWVKLAFLAAIGVWSATYLSFSVASLVSMGTFFIAEGSAFVNKSLESFGPKNVQGQWEAWRYITGLIADGVSQVFLIYSNLRPTGRLSTGMLLSWSEVARGTLVLAGITAVLYATGVLIFRRRELAMYSGQ